MEHTDHSARFLTCLRPKDLKDPECEVWIKVRNRLVGKEHLRLLKKRTGKCSPLLLTAGNFERTAMHVRTKTEGAESFKGFGLIGAREAGERAPPGISAKPAAQHIVKKRSIANEEKILEYDPQALAKGGWRVMATMCTAEDDLTLRRFERSSEASQKTGFPAPEGPTTAMNFPRGTSISIPRNNHRPRLSNPTREGSPVPEAASLAAAFGERDRFFQRAKVCGGVHLHQARSEDPIAKFRVFVVHGKQRGAQSRPVRIRNR